MNTTNKGKKLYRYEIDYLSQDNETQVNLTDHPIIRETEHTYFIKKHTWSTLVLRRVSKTAFNTFAYITKREAKDHFVRRTTKRISWYKYWLRECEKGLELIKEGTK